MERGRRGGHLDHEALGEIRRTLSGMTRDVSEGHGMFSKPFTSTRKYFSYTGRSRDIRTWSVNSARDAPLQTAVVLRPPERLFLMRHGNIILRARPAGQRLDLADQRGLRGLASAPRAPAPQRPLYGIPVGPVVVERNDLGIRHC